MTSNVWKKTAAIAAGLLGTVAMGALVARSRLPVRDDPSGHDIALVSIFDGSSLRPTSNAFTGGTIVSIFGGTALDLRRASLDGGHGLIQVTTIFGGTNITVPDGWRVTINGASVAGGVDRRYTDPTDLTASAPTLQIDATTIFGGLSVVARPVLRAAGETA